MANLLVLLGAFDAGGFDVGGNSQRPQTAEAARERESGISLDVILI